MSMMRTAPLRGLGLSVPPGGVDLDTAGDNGGGEPEVLGEGTGAKILDTLIKPGVWTCDLAAESGMDICTGKVGMYAPYLISAVLYGAGIFLLMKMARR